MNTEDDLGVPGSTQPPELLDADWKHALAAALPRPRDLAQHYFTSGPLAQLEPAQWRLGHISDPQRTERLASFRQRPGGNERAHDSIEHDVEVQCCF
jgi:hypothetical protein